MSVTWQLLEINLRGVLTNWTFWRFRSCIQYTFITIWRLIWEAGNITFVWLCGGKKDHLSSNLLAFTCFVCLHAHTPSASQLCYFKALADGTSDSLHNTLSTAVKVNVSGLAQASNVLQPLSCKFFPCFFFSTLCKSLLCIVRRLYRCPRLGRNRHTSSS